MLRSRYIIVLVMLCLCFNLSSCVDDVDFELEDFDVLLVAASAIIPVFGFDNWSYPNIKKIIIFHLVQSKSIRTKKLILAQKQRTVEK